MAGLLEFRGDHLLDIACGHGKGDQCGRNIQLFKGTGHGILAADGCEPELQLGLKCPQKRSGRLAPAVRALAGMQEVFLESQVGILDRSTGGDQAGDRFHNGKVCAVERTLFGDHGVIAIGHEGTGIGLAMLERDLLHHGLNGCQLMDTAERHQDRACADGGVKAFTEPAPGTDVQVCSQVLHAVKQGLRNVCSIRDRGGHMDHLMLFRTIGVKELAGDMDNGMPLPVHGQVGFFLDRGDDRGLKVLFCGKAQEVFGVLRIHHNGHALLRLGNGKLGTVQAFILLGDQVQLNIQTVCELADGDGNTAGTEVVAALDQQTGFRIAEQALELALFRRVAFLDLCTAGFQGCGGMCLGGTGGTAATVAAGGTAEQDHNVPGAGAFPAHILFGGCGNHGTDLHALGGIPGMVELIHNAGGQTDLVAV